MAILTAMHSDADKLQVSAMEVFSTIQFQPIFLSFSESEFMPWFLKVLTCFLLQKFWSKALNSPTFTAV